MKTILKIILLIISVSAYSQPYWYRDQTNTGVGNCGPAVVAMGAAWTTRPNIKVEDVRKILGYKRPDGSTTLDELSSALKRYSVPSYLMAPNSIDTLIALVEDENLIVIVAVDTTFISKSSRESYGRTYDYDGGHFIILENVVGMNFLVQDPLLNHHDRLYSVEEIWKAKKDKQVIVIEKVHDTKGLDQKSIKK